MFGLLHFSVGFYLLVGIHFWKAHTRRRTHYTLTNKRAFIATNPVFGKRSLNSHLIGSHNEISLHEGETSDVYFAKEVRRMNRSQGVETPFGFEDIHEGRKVFALLREVQTASLALTGNSTAKP